MGTKSSKIYKTAKWVLLQNIKYVSIENNQYQLYIEKIGDVISGFTYSETLSKSLDGGFTHTEKTGIYVLLTYEDIIKDLKAFKMPLSLHAKFLDKSEINMS